MVPAETLQYGPDYPACNGNERISVEEAKRRQAMTLITNDDSLL